MQKKILIVGADGMIGSHLSTRRDWTPFDVLATTRRAGTLNETRLFLDLFQQKEFAIPSDIEAAVVLAGGGNYIYCQNHPEEAARLGLECVPAFVERLLRAGIFTLYVSSTAVFGDTRLFPNEDAPLTPGGVYGEFKAEGEKRITALAERIGMNHLLAIPRLSKVVNKEKTQPLPSWLEAWSNGSAVTPFIDLNLCPLTPDYAAAFLSAIIRTRQSGVWHCSGDRNVSFAEFCRLLADRLGVNQDLIRPVLSRDAGVALTDRGKTPGLGMKRTTEFLGIRSQTMAAALDSLAKG